MAVARRCRRVRGRNSLLACTSTVPLGRPLDLKEARWMHRMPQTGPPSPRPLSTEKSTANLYDVSHSYYCALQAQRVVPDPPLFLHARAPTAALGPLYSAPTTAVTNSSTNNPKQEHRASRDISQYLTGLCSVVPAQSQKICRVLISFCIGCYHLKLG